MHTARTGNRLLANLPELEYNHLAPHLKQIKMKVGQVPWNPDETLSYVYFPNDCVISLLTELGDGRAVEVGVVGAEGMADVGPILGHATSSKLAIVQGEGTAMRLPVQVLVEEFARGGQFQRVLLRYLHALISQISQTAACNRRHSIESRLARWLLMNRDRTPSDELPLTHEFLAGMLGTQRPGITLALKTLEKAGVIEPKRGKIVVLDRVGLEEIACDCYHVVKKEFDSLYQ